MNSIERGKFELDPSYDPERLDAKNKEQERSHEREVDLRPEFEIFRDNERVEGSEDGDDIVYDGATRVIRLAIPEYTFLGDGNPYAWDAEPVQSLAPIARQLDAVIAKSFAWNDVLVRAVQATGTGMTRGELLTKIRRLGYDQPQSDGEYDFHAAQYLPFTKDSSTLQIFEAFHKWKPKCEDKPQPPIDIVMVFDAKRYEAVEHVHSRHGVVASDRYRLRGGSVRADALLAIILIN